MMATRSFSILYPCYSPYVGTFSTLLKQAHSVRLQLKFLRDCLAEQVLPRSLLPVRLMPLYDRPFNEFSTLLLKKHIEITKENEKKSFKNVNIAKRNFHNVIPLDWKQQLMDEIYNSLRRKLRKMTALHARKLNKLIDNSDWNRHSNLDCVINLTGRELDKNALLALGYGLSFAVPKNPTAMQISRNIVEMERRHNIDPTTTAMVKGIVYGAMCCENNQQYPRRFQIALNKLKQESDLHITRADKSNAFVIMNKTDYVDKMNMLLSDDTTYEILRCNPQSKIISSFNAKLKQILRGQKELITKFLTVAPSIPYMYGLVKTHKENHPMRPIVSSVNAISYKLSKWLVKVLTPLLGSISSSHLINSCDLVNKLNGVNITSQHKLVSFDVCSLFTRVPVNDLLQFLSEKLSNLELPLQSAKIIALIELCIVDCRFIFNGMYYKQIFGMAMGNCLSPLLANIYMEFYENRYLPPLIPNDVTWLRYVDDVLCIWPVNRNTEEFLLRLNTQVPTIKFTLETERNNCLPFLDVLIHRENNQLQYSVYRKPTNNLSYVHSYSYHDISVKKSIFVSMFIRAFRICSPPYFDSEIEIIYNIGKKLCYSVSFIDECFGKAKKSVYLPSNIAPINMERNILVLPYFNNFIHIKKIFQCLNIHIVFRNDSTLKRIVIKNSPNSDQNIIYNIPCKDCNLSYIGQTSKPLTERVQRHKYEVRQAFTTNSLYNHIHQHDHRIDWQGASILTRCNEIVSRNLAESALIQLLQKDNKLLNNSSGLYIHDLFILHLFRSDFQKILSKFTN